MTRVLDRLTASPRRLFVAVALFVVLDLSILVINLWIAHQVALDAVAINLAGRQRMLSQRLTKAALLASTDPGSPAAQAARGEMMEAATLFDSTLAAFIHGGPAQGGDGTSVTLRPVQTPEGHAALSAVFALWRTSDPLRTRIAGGDPVAIGEFRHFLVANNLRLLDGMNRLTTSLEQSSVASTNQLRAIQSLAFMLAMINFLLILGSLLRQQRSATRAQLHWQSAAHQDVLTGVNNRAAFETTLTQAIDDASHNPQALTLMMLDLDAFKPINDSFGHAVGDLVLQQFAKGLSAVARSTDTVARLGGDEFVILCPKLETPEHIDDFCRRIFGEVAQIHIPDYPELKLGTSIGVAIFPADAKEANALLRVADAAMYAAKRQGGNRYQLGGAAFTRL